MLSISGDEIMKSAEARSHAIGMFHTTAIRRSALPEKNGDGGAAPALPENKPGRVRVTNLRLLCQNALGGALIRRKRGGSAVPGAVTGMTYAIELPRGGAPLPETVRGSLGSWYANAIEDAGIVPVGDPQVALGDLPGEGEALTFSIEIGVRPTAKLGEYQGLEVGRREPDVEEEAVEKEVENLRERLARLETVERPASSASHRLPIKASKSRIVFRFVPVNLIVARMLTPSTRW